MKKGTLLSLIILSSVQCTKKESKTAETTLKTEVSLDSLKSYAEKTKVLLASQLTQKIKDSGTVGALEFCNIEALPLTKSMSDQYHLEIKRVSDKNRNSNQYANEEERKYIEMYKAQLLKGEKLKPTKTETHFYAPIVTNTMCLQCHGEKGKDIKPDVLATITVLYPNDKATGYKENEVRGLMSIKFK